MKTYDERRLVLVVKTRNQRLVALTDALIRFRPITDDLQQAA